MSLLSALSNFGMSSSAVAEETAAPSWFASVFPVAHSEEEEKEEADEEKADDEAEKSEEADEEADEKEEDEDEDEDEDDDDDTMPAIYEECEKSSACGSVRHHFEECQERVTGGKGFPHEDCTEELAVI
ncbi:ubiquinol--cytochrome-c reductase subunit 6 [Malassezia japonica]|uniref:Ubiquinol--cytochrome-c reductase subunit 6 n=1 Tax=Malassezia japonica TaxID=223818 RepID=A0AAF0EXK9_9BASI|nr:ubiquinol--cytochrome-c reductase subunit 6 [Malassezia japonica]WFD38916.1 ubiquinol--cytochrome-c reductase subunit 6 [Malassezia japonica]